MTKRSIDIDLQCDKCCLEFDLSDPHRKSLTCGHTICEACVSNPDLERKCPLCIKHMKKEVPSREHEQQMQQLERGIAAGRKLVAQLGKVVPTAISALKQLQESSAIQVMQINQALEELRRGEAGAGAGEVVLKQAEQLVDGLRLMSVPKSSLVAVEEDGTVWKALEELGPVGHLLLLQLRADGRLEKGDGSAEAGPALRLDHGDAVSRSVQPSGEAEPSSHEAAVDAKTPLQDGDQRGEAMELDTPNHSDEAVEAEDNPFVGPPGISVLAIDKKSDFDGETLKVEDIFKSKRWLHARSLRNLKGSGSEVLLRVLAPQLEELEIAGDAPLSVMEEVAKMKSLKRLMVECDEKVQDYPDLPLQLEELNITCPKENQLRCVARMPRLRSLKVWNDFGANMSFVPSSSRHAGLVWLAVAFDDTHWSTALSLIRAHAQSLRVLQIYCGAYELHHEGYYFSKLGEELAAIGLQALEQLVLLRPSAKCDHVGDCLVQLRSLRESLRNSVDVVCNVCPRW